MKIGLQTWGTDGDVRPFFALGHRLQERGHEVTLGVTSTGGKEYAAMARALGLRLVQSRNVPSVTSPPVLAEKNPLKQLKQQFEISLVPYIDEIYSLSEQLCRENDLVIGSYILYPLYIAAEKTGMPAVSVSLAHHLPSRLVTPIGAPNLGAWLNPFWWRVAEWLLDSMFRPLLDDLRLQVGLPPAYRMNFLPDSDLNLVAVSPEICQQQPEWEGRHQVCGFLNLPESGEVWQVPRAVELFLAEGPAPVYFTFGSVLAAETDERQRVIRVWLEAVRRVGCRAIVQVPTTDLLAVHARSDVLFVDNLPHRHVFPRCAAIVHHGGSGTTQTALRSGCPSVVVYHITDQSFWGNELQRLGVAPRSLAYRRLTARRLARKLDEVLARPEMKATAERIGEAMRRENGVEKAVELIEDQYERMRASAAMRSFRSTQPSRGARSAT
jgi:UDP:flavonoid glycosyltransferase YjiC (YdhE family)